MHSAVTVRIINLGSNSIDVSVKHWQDFLKDKRLNFLQSTFGEEIDDGGEDAMFEKCFPGKEIF